MNTQTNVSAAAESLPAANPKRKKKSGVRSEMRKNRMLFLMMVPGLLVLLINSYLPMGGLVMAFQKINYRRFAFFGDWVGLQNLDVFFKSPFAAIITENTLKYNFLFIIFGTVVALFFAIALNELTGRRKSKFYQTVMFLPYYMSWVVITYIVAAFLSNDYGFLNKVLLPFFGAQPVNWYASPQYWPTILVLLNVWKGAGYGSVMYLAAITNIDQTYYEAARIDGATKMQQIFKITLPMLKPMIIILTLLSVGKIFNTDIGLFYSVPMIVTNGGLTTTTSTIDTYVYMNLIDSSASAINIAAAAAFLQSFLGFALVVITNAITKKISAENALF
jgi:putative aldouronate transport system permease protein